MPWREIVAGLIGATLVLLVAWPLGWFPLYVEDCYYDQAGHQECPSHHIMLFAFLHAGKLLNDASLVITAFATAAIAYFTLTLRDINRNQLGHYRRVERAHVSILSPQSELRLDNNGLIIGLRLCVVWKNSGSTPASPIDALIGATWVPAIDQFRFGQVEQQGIRQPFVLGPSAEIASGTVDIGVGHVNAIFNGQGFQFLWGWARYRDIFPNSPEHVVEFCFRVTIDGQLGPPPSLAA